MRRMWTHYPDLLQRPVPRYTSYPTAADFNDSVGPDAVAEALRQIGQGTALSLYFTDQFGLTSVVCLGTACYVKGADKIMAAIEQRAGIKAGETTPDNKLSLLSARCIGACGIAPAVVYDGTVAAKQTAEGAVAKVQPWLSSHGS